MSDQTKTLTLSEFLKARLDEAEQRVSDPTFCSSPWPSVDEMLEDIMSKRAIVNLHSGDNDEPCQSYAGNWSYVPCATLRLLAAPYRRHPDFREEWA